MTVTPFKIAVPDEDIQRLRVLLDNTPWADDVDVSDPWQRGAPLKDVKRLAEYWRHKHDWRAAESKLNELPQFKTQIQVDGFDPVDVHFVHKKSGVAGAIPLLFVHGWPGSFIEVVKLLPLLTDGAENGPVFDVVAPSLPNYGFSGKVLKGGFGMEQYAECLHKLMLRLGYEEYTTQGGDWGTMITRTLGALYPKHVRSSHINLIIATPPTWQESPLTALEHRLTPYTDSEKRGLARGAWFAAEGRGYSQEQSTKPQTLGYGLAASPVFLLAWIYEKLHDWTDSYPWTDDEICTWISIYQFSTAGPQASVRIYYESAHAPTPRLDQVAGRPGRDAGRPFLPPAIRGYVPDVKLGLAFFPKEISPVPEIWTRNLGPVVYRKHHPSGGHFAAWERPEAIAGDLRAMYGKGGPCFGIIKGKDGVVTGAAARL